MKALRISLAMGWLGLLTACGNGSTTYSLLSEGQTFQQNTAQQMTKIDVLWVVDNSGSMASSQQNLANNFPTFIQRFLSKGFDFHMGVTTTDAYLAESMWTSYYNQNPHPSYYDGLPQANIAWLKDGTAVSPSGFPIITPSTPNINNVFMQNAMQGINGRGDERSFDSIRSALSSTHNSSFIRPGSFLAVIILTDEDDFSNPSTTAYETYVSQLNPISDYVSFLDGLTLSSGPSRRYSVNTISVKDQTCLDQIYNGAQKIGQRVMQLADATGGVKGNICGDFGQELDLISKSIVELSTQFYLQQKPIESTIKVFVNNQLVPKIADNPSGGWYYNATANSVVFQGTAVPPQGAAINVTFDPESLDF
jgi:hypothetical protein